MVRLPPQNIEAEQATIGSMLIEREAVARVVENVIAEDFYKTAHQIIFSAILELYEQSEPSDLITITEILRKRNLLEKAGDVAYLTELINSVPTAANVEYHARIVSEKSILRKLISAGTNIVEMGYNDEMPIKDLIDTSEQLVYKIGQQKSSRDFRPLGEILVTTFETIEKLYHQKTQITGLPTGFAEFDYKTAGLQASDLIILAARPSMGKTALSLNIAQHIALREQKTVAIFSFEMSENQLAQRILCAEAGIEAQRLRTGRLEEKDWPKITKALAALSGAQIYIDSSYPNIMEMRSKARRLKSTKNLSLIVIDYLQIMPSISHSDNRTNELGKITRQLKALAKELDVPIIALSQLSRGVESRNDKRPMLSDLRESGAIEQDADLVVFIYRDDYYNPNSEKQNVAEIIISKHRNGPTGSIELVFLKEFTKFVNRANNVPVGAT